MTRIRVSIRLLSDVSRAKNPYLVDLLILAPVFGLPPKFVAAALGDIGIEQIAGLESKV